MIKALLYTFACIVIAVTSASAGNDLAREKSAGKLVSGKVVDKVSGEELAGVEIRIEGKIVYTDLQGNFTMAVQNAHPEATVNLISYSESKVTLNTFSYNSLVLELESR